MVSLVPRRICRSAPTNYPRGPREARSDPPTRSCALRRSRSVRVPTQDPSILVAWVTAAVGEGPGSPAPSTSVLRHCADGLAAAGIARGRRTGGGARRHQTPPFRQGRGAGPRGRSGRQPAPRRGWSAGRQGDHARGRAGHAEPAGPRRLLRRALPARRPLARPLGEHRRARGGPDPDPPGRDVPRPPGEQQGSPAAAVAAAGPSGRGAVRPRGRGDVRRPRPPRAPPAARPRRAVRRAGERTCRRPVDPRAAGRAGRGHETERQPGAAASGGPVHRRAGPRQDQGHRPLGPGPQGRTDHWPGDPRR